MKPKSVPSDRPHRVTRRVTSPISGSLDASPIMRAVRKRAMARKGLGKAAEAVETALPDLLAFSPTSTVAIVFSLVAISSSRVRTRFDLE